MRYRITKVYHNADFDVIEITNKKTGEKENYAFPIQSNDIRVKLKVKEEYK